MNEAGKEEKRRKEWSYRHDRAVFYCIITQYVKTVGQIDELEGRRGGRGTVESFPSTFLSSSGRRKKKRYEMEEDNGEQTNE